MLFVNDASEGHTWDSHNCTAQGNFISTLILQAENSHIKITLCIQYLNGQLLSLCLHQANHWCMHPQMFAIILTKLLNET